MVTGTTAPSLVEPGQALLMGRGDPDVVVALADGRAENHAEVNAGGPLDHLELLRQADFLHGGTRVLQPLKSASHSQSH